MSEAVRSTGAATSVEIIEVSPRDGIQNEGVILTTDQKVQLIGRAVAAGFRRIEATSFAHPQRVPQMADAEAVLAALPPVDGGDLHDARAERAWL